MLDKTKVRSIYAGRGLGLYGTWHAHWLGNGMNQVGFGVVCI